MPSSSRPSAPPAANSGSVPAPSAGMVTPQTNAAPAAGVPANITPAQTKALEVLLNRYMAGKMTTEQYNAARDKILAGGK